jgi:hypothetical protein
VPHHVILDDTGQVAEDGEPGWYFIYSTIVDGALTDLMDEDTMATYLRENGYGSHMCETREDLVKFYRDNGKEWLADSLMDELPGEKLHSHWNGQFKYGTLSEAYYCLPYDMWRNGE